MHRPTVDRLTGPGPAPGARGLPSILLVTDDEALAAIYIRPLERAGHLVTHASHSGHALLACLGGPRRDLLLTELSLPDASGPELGVLLRRYFPGMRALYIAAPDTAQRSGNVLVQPFTDQELVARVQATLTVSPAS